MNRSWWRGWRSWTSDAQLVTHTSACRRTHTSASPCHTSATRRAADVGFVLFSRRGLSGVPRRCAGLCFHMKKQIPQFYTTRLHYSPITRLHDNYPQASLFSLYIYIYMYVYWLLTPVSHLSNPISYPLLPLSGRSPLSFISSFLSLLVARCSLLSTL